MTQLGQDHEPYGVFLSYSHDDYDAMDTLYALLIDADRRGVIRLWVDERIRAGDRWNEAILKELDAADAVVLLLSAHSLRSEFCMTREITHAEEVAPRRPRIIPFLIDEGVAIAATRFDEKEALAKLDGKLLAPREWPLERKAYQKVAETIIKLAAEHRAGAQPPRAGAVRRRWKTPPLDSWWPRDEQIEQIRRSLLAQPGTPLVLSGASGSGKSTLAYQYALAHESVYDHVVMMTAESAESFAEEWRAMAEWLGLPGSDTPSASSLLRDWLAENYRWLLVIDGAYSSEILERLPAMPRGDIIVTSYEDFSDRNVRVMDVGPLGPDQAVALVSEVAGPDADPADVRELCETLGYRPVALDAAMHELKRGSTPRRYLAELRQTGRSS